MSDTAADNPADAVPAEGAVTTTFPEVGDIVAEEDNWDNDNDSALGDTSVASATTSLGESIFKHRQENGRTYHAYKDGKYMAPNDDGENDRLDLQHHLCVLTMEGKLHLCPAGKDNALHRVLDVGTGTGIVCKPNNNSKRTLLTL